MESKKGGRPEEKPAHIVNDTTLDILMIGTETKLREPGAPHDRAKAYGALAARLDILVVGRGAPAPDLAIAENTTVIDALRPSYLASLLAAFGKGRGILRSMKGGLITAQDPFEIGLIAYLLSLSSGASLHLQIHTDPGSAIWRDQSAVNRIRYALFRFLVRRADGIRVVSARVKSLVESLGVPSERIAVIPIHAEASSDDAVPLDLRETYRDATHLIAAIGRFEHEKGFDVLLRAFARLRKTFSGALLLLVGKGSEEHALRKLARELDVDAAVKFIPWARNLKAYYEGTDCVAVPSRYEGWGLVPVEALVAGGYVVMTDVGCAGEAILHEKTGLVVPPEDHVALSDAIDRMLVDAELRRTIDRNRKKSAEALATKQDFYRLQQESWTYAARKGTERKKA